MTFLTCLMIAGDLDDGRYSGRMETQSGPYTVEEIAADTGMRPKLQRDALDELVGIGFLTRDLSGAYIVARFEEKSAPKSYLSTERMREHRSGKRDQAKSSQTRRANRHGDTPEEEADNYASLRSAAIGYGQWPTETPYLNALALLFLDRFANTRDADAAKKQLGAYTSTLAGMRQRGATIEQAWSACEEAWKADGEQLWGAKIRRAFDFLPSWRDRGETRKKRATDRGTDFDKLADEQQKASA